MVNSRSDAFYNRIRQSQRIYSEASNRVSTNQKRSRAISLPYIAILAHTKGYQIRQSTTGPVLKLCKIIEPRL